MTYRPHRILGIEDATAVSSHAACPTAWQEFPMGPAPMETVSEAVERLTRAGYREQFRSTQRGLTDSQDVVHDPEHMVVDEFVRFEGASNPDDEAVVFALRDGINGLRGTYTVAYGAEMDPLDADMVRRLRAWIPDFDPALARHGEDE